MKGLSCGAITTRKLEGVDRDKGHTREFYTSSAPYNEGKSLRLVGFGIAEVSISKGLNSLAWLSIWLFLALSRNRVVPLYTWVDAWRPIESRPANNRIRLGDFLYMPFFTSIPLHTAVCNIGP